METESSNDCPTGLLIDFDDDSSPCQKVPSPLTTLAEYDDTFGIFQKQGETGSAKYLENSPGFGLSTSHRLSVISSSGPAKDPFSPVFLPNIDSPTMEPMKDCSDENLSDSDSLLDVNNLSGLSDSENFVEKIKKDNLKRKSLVLQSEDSVGLNNDCVKGVHIENKGQQQVAAKKRRESLNNRLETLNKLIDAPLPTSVVTSNGMMRIIMQSVSNLVPTITVPNVVTTSATPIVTIPEVEENICKSKPEIAETETEVEKPCTSGISRTTAKNTTASTPSRELATPKRVIRRRAASASSFSNENSSIFTTPTSKLKFNFSTPTPTTPRGRLSIRSKPIPIATSTPAAKVPPPQKSLMLNKSTNDAPGSSSGSNIIIKQHTTTPTKGIPKPTSITRRSSISTSTVSKETRNYVASSLSRYGFAKK